jgi:hypothetical protein
VTARIYAALTRLLLERGRTGPSVMARETISMVFSRASRNHDADEADWVAAHKHLVEHGLPSLK